MNKKIAKKGWKPDLPDFRDFKYQLNESVSNLPSVDLRPYCPKVVDQGQLGSCTGNAIANAHYFTELKEKIKSAFLPSRLFIYYNERVIEKTVRDDAGAEIRDGIKSISKQGVCAETLWPYSVRKFATKPSLKCYSEALKHKAVSYMRLDNTDITQLKNCLSDGYPFVFGFTVYESFESDEVANTGVVNMPTDSEENLGGHAVMCVGYDDNSSRFIVMNSWGKNWGDNGYFTIPYQYLTDTNLADDFWTIRLVR